MRPRIRKTIHFLSANLLIFSLYLSFFHHNNLLQAGGIALKLPAFGDSNTQQKKFRATREITLELKGQTAQAVSVNKPLRKL